MARTGIDQVVAAILRQSEDKRHPKPQRVGTRGLDYAVPSRAVKQRLKRRATRAADRAFAPQIEAARAAVQQVRGSDDRELASIEGATNIVESSLDQQIAGLKHSGLEGRYLKDAVEELTSRRADLPTSEQFLKADVRADTHAAVQDARQNVADLRVDREVEAANAFTSLLNSSFEDAESAAARRRTAGQDKRENEGLTDDQKQRARDLEFARHELTRFLSAKPDLTKQLYGASPDEAKSLLASLEEAVRKGEGVTGPAAAKVIADLASRLDEMRDEPLNQAGPVALGQIADYFGG